MTDLDKPVKRRTHVMHQGRRLIVELRPDQSIGFRLEGTQQTCIAPIHALFLNAQRIDSGVYIPPRRK